MEPAARIVADAPLAVQAGTRIAPVLRDGARPAEGVHGKLTRESAHAIAWSADAREGVRASPAEHPPVRTGG